MPLNDIEKNLFNFDKNIIKRLNLDLDRGDFYLGGQIKMTHNELIDLESIQKVREINIQRNKEYGGPCNSWEAASMYKATKELELIENMIIKYNDIMEIREKQELNKSNSSNYI